MLPQQHKLYWSPLLLSIVALSTAPSVYAAANFQIIPTPGRAFPSTVLEGTTVSAYYTITNHTLSTRSGYYIQGLPQTVRQNSTKPSNCPSTITLPSKGSCILQLDISGKALADVALCKGSSCTKSATPLAVQTAPMPPFIAAGYFQRPMQGTKPLLAASQDGGEQWNYAIADTPLLPAGCTLGAFAEGYGTQFNDWDCNGSSCVAVGQCTKDLASNNRATWPLIATSTDSGRSWRYTMTPNNSLLPRTCAEDFTSSFKSSSCSGTQCVAVGDCVTPGGTGESRGFPLLASSTNSGNTWRYSAVPTLPDSCLAGENQHAVLNSSSCSGSSCVAVGDCFTPSLVSAPLIMSSSDGGISWRYTLGGNNAGLSSVCDISTGSNASFANTSCSGTQCVATGACVDYTLGSTKPLLAYSKDRGLTWRYAAMTLPSNNFWTFASNVSCSGPNCVVVANSPLLASSSDGGSTWRYPISRSTPTLPNGCLPGEFTLAATSCSEQSCVAVGRCTTPNGFAPLIAQSKNGGASWIYTNATTTLSLLSPNQFLQLSTVYCKGLICTATGSYLPNANGRILPLIATSNDGGITWHYTLNANKPVLPLNSIQASLSENKNL